MTPIREVVASLLLFAASASPALAADPWEYCYGANCQSTLAAAEQLMREDHMHGSLLTQKASEVHDSGAGVPYTVIRYHVPDQPPETVLPPYFLVGSSGVNAAYCPATPGPGGNVGCLNEAATVEAAYQRSVTHPDYAGCAFTPYVITGSHVAPFSYLENISSSTTYNLIVYVPPVGAWKTVKFSIDCGYGAAPQELPIYKWSYFTCPAGMQRREGWSVTTAPSGVAPVAESEMCRSTQPEPAIVSRQALPVACESGNCNPTYPGTGDKARFETDLTFAGRPFIRSYHSIRQGGQLLTLAPGWTHSYSDRILANYAGGSKPVIDDKGYMDFYTYAGPGVYRSTADPSRVIRVLSDRQRLIEADGTVREFDFNGVLLRVYHPKAPADATELAYDSEGNLTTLTDARGRQLELLYSDAGRLMGLRKALGEEVLYGYDADRNLTSVLYPSGGTRRYHYGEAGLSGSGQQHLLTGITDENNHRYASFGYDTRGRVILSQLHTGNPTSPTHDRTTLTYTSATTVQLTRSTGDAVTYSFSPDSMRRTLARQDGRGVVAKTYDGLQRVTQVTDSAGVVTQYGYNETYLNSVTEAVGTPEERRTLIQRDAFQQVVSTVLQKKVAGAFVNDVVQIAATDAFGRTTAKCLIDAGSTSAAYVCGSLVAAPIGVRQTRFQYCDETDVASAAANCPILGQLKMIDGPRTDVADATRLEYYGASDLSGCATGGACHRKGDLFRVLDAAGYATSYTRYDLAGRLLRSVDANGVVTDRAYDERGWLVSIKERGTDNSTESDDAITRMEYDSVGQLGEVTAPDGSVVAFTYDHAHRLTSVTDGHGNTIVYDLDGSGNRIGEELRDSGGALRHRLSRIYDQLGQLGTLADSNDTPTDLSYDAQGNVDLVTDALGRIADHDHDALGRLRHSIANANANGSGVERAVSQFEYDDRDNLVAVTDPKGLTTRYDYDGLGNLVELQSPDTGTATHSYDSAGNRIGQTDARGVETGYEYDAANRLSLIRTISSQPGGGNVLAEFSYDTAPVLCGANQAFAAGRLSGFTDPSGGTTYCYDHRGNVVRKMQQNAGGQDKSLTYGYTTADRVSSINYPSGLLVTYARNAAGQIIGVTARASEGVAPVDLVTAADYLPFGPIQRMVFGNGRVLDKNRDLDYGIASVADSAADGLAIGYTLDDVGNVVGLAERQNGGATAVRTVDYDGLDRLKAIKNGATTVQGFTYDATGNRTTKVAGTSATYVYDANSHRLTKVGTVNRGYDAAGNTAAIGTRTYQYDDRGRMASVRTGTNLTQSYQYNALGQRVAKIHPTTAANTVYFVYDEAGKVMGEYKPDGTMIREYIWLDDTLVAMRAGYATHKFQYVLTDHLNTPRAVVLPSTNAIIWRWDLTTSAFGDHAAQNNPDGDGTNYMFNLRYPGQYFDSETGLHYNYFRDYEPGTGRYVQSDPIGLAGGTSTFGYVHGSPLTMVDPTGLRVEICRRGNDVDILLYAIFNLQEGVTPQDMRRVITAAEQGWSGPIGGYNVNLTIVAMHPTEAASAILSPASGPFRPVISVGSGDGSGGQWNTQQWFSGAGAEHVAIHEVGHFLTGMGNLGSNHIRKSVLAPLDWDENEYRVYGSDIDRVLGNPRHVNQCYSSCSGE